MRTFIRARNRQDEMLSGIYVRDGRFYAGYTVEGKWKMKILAAKTADAALVERDRLVRRERGHIKWKPEPEPRLKDLDEIYNDARRLAQRISLLKPQVSPEVRRILAQAEGSSGHAADLVFDAWRRSQL